MDNINNKWIRINTLGEFSIMFCNRNILKRDNRSKKLWQLIALLLLNPGEVVSQGKLIRILWPNPKACSDSANSLKNLVYRARNLLNTFVGNECDSNFSDCVVFSNGGYAWNMSIPCTFDLVEMEQLIKSADESDAAVRLELLQRAISLYKGSYFREFGQLEGVSEKREHCDMLFQTAVCALCELLNINGQPAKVIDVCKEALDVCPFNIEIHMQLLRTYMDQNNHRVALEHYSVLADSFAQAGRGVPHTIFNLYQLIMSEIQNVQTDIEHICSTLIDADQRCPLICDMMTFKRIIRIEASSQYRSGELLQVALVTLKKLDNSVADFNKIAELMSTLEDVLMLTLRVNDVVVRYSPSQFLLAIMVKNTDDGETVLGRIKKNFAKHLTEDITLVTTLKQLR